MIHEIKIYMMTNGKLTLNRVVSSSSAEKLFWQARKREDNGRLRPNSLSIEQIRNIAAAKRRFSSGD